MAVPWHLSSVGHPNSRRWWMLVYKDTALEAAIWAWAATAAAAALTLENSTPSPTENP